ncbi:MAG: hypothetical protein LBM08_06805 [Dysgonamonadaceae bacterium]|nr:hypothetical protein [Dysgonamonadaceae bacterium]
MNGLCCNSIRNGCNLGSPNVLTSGVLRRRSGAAKPRNILSDEWIRFDSCNGHKNISGLRRSDGGGFIPYPALKRRATNISPRWGYENRPPLFTVDYRAFSP